MSAITTKINALWRTVHGKSAATVPKIERLDRNNVECVEEVRPSQRNFAEEERYVNRQKFETARIPGRRLWRLDSNTEIELDKVHDRKPKLDLDLRIPPRVRPQHTARIQENPETTNQKALQPNPVQDYDYERGRKETSERRFEERQQRRSESTHRHPADKPNKGVMHRSGRSKERSTDMDRSKSNRQLRSSKTQQTLQTHGSYRTRKDRSPPDDDSDGEDSSDSDHRRRDKDKKRYPRRRDDSSPSDDDDGSNDGSSSDEDPSHNTRKHLRIKLQKFDGTTSWESWWAHFQNCASYNRWNDRDKLAFMKGALTGNASQVLWDTDRTTLSKKFYRIL